MQAEPSPKPDSIANTPLVSSAADDARFRRLVEVSAVGVMTGDETGRIHYMNRALQELLGYNEHEVYGSGLRWTELTPPEYVAADLHAIAELQARGAATPYEKAYRTKNGHQVPVLVSPVVLEQVYDEHRLVAAFVIDLRAQKAAEHSTAQVVRLQRLTAALAGALTPLEIAQLINTHGCAAFEAQASFIALATPDGKHFELTHSLGYRPEQTRPWQRFSIDQPLPATDAARSGEPVLLASVDELLARYPQLAPLRWVEYHARAAIPLSVEGRVLGVMLLSFVAPRQFSAEDVALMQTLGQICAQALERARLYELEREAVRERDAFLSVAAHELKTPLTALVGQVQLLQRRAQRESFLNERDQRALQVVRSQADRLTTMVNELLDLSRMGSGQLEIVCAALHLDELVQHIVDELQPTLPRHQIVYCALATTVAVSGDITRLTQVLRNLLGNAVKYSPDGGHIELTLTTQGDEAVIAIRDYGIGIPPEALPLLWERFYRAPNATARHIDGVGVGLFVVKEIVARHGGTISVESTLGQGSVFTLRLPLSTQNHAP